MGGRRGRGPSRLVDEAALMLLLLLLLRLGVVNGAPATAEGAVREEVEGVEGVCAR